MEGFVNPHLASTQCIPQISASRVVSQALPLDAASTAMRRTPGINFGRHWREWCDPVASTRRPTRTMPPMVVSQVSALGRPRASSVSQRLIQGHMGPRMASLADPRGDSSMAASPRPQLGAVLTEPEYQVNCPGSARIRLSLVEPSGRQTVFLSTFRSVLRFCGVPE